MAAFGSITLTHRFRPIWLGTEGDLMPSNALTSLKVLYYVGASVTVVLAERTRLYFWFSSSGPGLSSVAGVPF